MQVSVSGKQIDIGANLRAYVEEKLTNIVSKYYNNPIKSTVTFSREGSMIKSDVSVHPISGVVIQGEGESPDAYNAYDESLERINKQLKKYKQRLTDHKGAKAESVRFSVIESESEEVEASASEDETPIIVADMQTELPLCTVSGAVMRMNLANLPALMFRNTAHGGLNMVYRRNDGNIGWVDPGQK